MTVKEYVGKEKKALDSFLKWWAVQVAMASLTMEEVDWREQFEFYVMNVEDPSGEG